MFYQWKKEKERVQSQVPWISFKETQAKLITNLKIGQVKNARNILSKFKLTSLNQVGPGRDEILWVVNKKQPLSLDKSTQISMVIRPELRNAKLKKLFIFMPLVKHKYKGWICTFSNLIKDNLFNLSKLKKY